MVTEIRIEITLRKGLLTERENKNSFWGAGNVLCLNLDGSYAGVLTLGKHIHSVCLDFFFLH
jgi:hypothetical protein